MFPAAHVIAVRVGARGVPDLAKAGVGGRASHADGRQSPAALDPLPRESHTFSTRHQMVNYKERRLDRIFSALSDPTRRSILARLEGQARLSISELAEPFAMTLPAVLKHLDVLADVGLIRRSKRGRTVWVEIEAGSMKLAMDWLERHRLFWTAGVDRLARYAEAKERESGGAK